MFCQFKTYGWQCGEANTNELELEETIDYLICSYWRLLTLFITDF